MKLFILIAVATYASASPLLGSKKCSWGPSYWCSHVSRAKECGAMGHCMTTVWKNQIIKPQASETCTICQLMVEEIRQKLKNKATTEEIGSFLAEGCSLLPGDEMKQKCKKVVEEDLPELLQLVDSGLDGKVVCAAIGFCTGVEDLPRQNEKSTALAQVPKTYPLPKPKPKAPSKICTDCKTFMGDIDAILSDNSTVQQVEDMLEQIMCSQLGAFQTMCKQLVEKYVPVGLQLLAEQFDPQMVCIMMGFCSNQEGREQAMMTYKTKMVEALKQIKKAGATGEECDLCKSGVKELRDLIRNGTSQRMVLDFIENNLCSVLGLNTSLGAQCKELVEQYGPTLFELLASELDPVALCTMLGFCNPNSTRLALVLTPAKVSAPVTEGSGELCEVCEIAMQALDALLEQHVSKVEIENALNQVCDKLGGNMAEECRAMVTKYTPQIVEYIIQQLDPQKICGMLGLCQAKKVKDPQAGPGCVLCEFVLKTLESTVNRNSSKKEVEQALDRVCDLLPTTIRAECKTFVLQYEPSIINLLLQEFAPDKVCAKLKLCTSVEQVPLLPVSVPKESQLGASVQCVLCEFAMKELKSLLKQNATEEEIKKALDEVCNLLPISIRDQCTAFIDEYEPAILDLLLQELDAGQICTALGLCSGSLSATQPLKETSIGVDAECMICEFVMKQLDSLLSNKATQQEIEQALDQVCGMLPKTVSADCSQFVEKYSAMIIQLLLQEMTPQTLCTALGLCQSSQPEKVQQPPVPLLPLLLHGAPIAGAVQATNNECLVCQMIVNYITMALKDNATEEDIIKALTSVCGLLPSDLKSVCDGLVQQYAQQIAEYLAQKIDPRQICQKLDLCQANKVQAPKTDPKPVKSNSLENNTLYFKTKLLGTKECTYGPDYWCASRENAERCKAVHHCMKHGWKSP